MRGLGAFQMAQMKHKDARVLQFYRHLRSAIDVLELIALDPYQPPEKPTPEPVAMPAPPPPAIPQEKLTFSVKEASAALSLSKTTIWKAIADGVLPAQKFGNRTLIPADGLRAWLASMPSARKRRPGRR
ncbi:MAG: helix-turn-helix domain-containing protein [Hyphomonadaceae bacterium]